MVYIGYLVHCVHVASGYLAIDNYNTVSKCTYRLLLLHLDHAILNNGEVFGKTVKRIIVAPT